jgi:hypothetical protein
MKRQFALLAVFTLLATSAFAHAGHAHTYMGTVTMLHGDNAFMIKTAEGKDITITTSPTTKYLHADNHAANRSEIVVGSRVVVKMKTDGKTAASVKIGSGKKTAKN